MPRKIETEVFTFDELSKKSKAKAIEDWRDAGNPTDFLDEDLKDLFEGELNEVGLPADTVYWGLGHTQGDGVAFYGSVDLDDYLKQNKLLKKFGKLLDFDVSAKIEGASGNYHHSNSMDVQVDYDEPDVLEGPKEWTPGINLPKLTDELQDHMNEHVEEVSRKLEKMGYDEIDYLNSDEAITDTLEGNDYEYTADGKRW